MKLSDKIRIIRKARGYSQEELGYKLNRLHNSGISRQAISDWENGNCEPKLDNIRDLADVLGVSFDALLDEKIDLEDRKQLNVVLKNLDSEIKGKINNSFRYRIYFYKISKFDVGFLIGYITLLVFSIVGIACSYIFMDDTSAIFIIRGLLIGLLIGVLICTPTLFRSVKRIKKGTAIRNVFGTLSQTHFVVIGWSDSQFDRTIYIPVEEIISMSLDKGASKKHGRVIVKVKDRNKPIITSDIVNPQKLIDVFNNRETFIENYNDL